MVDFEGSETYYIRTKILSHLTYERLTSSSSSSSSSTVHSPVPRSTCLRGLYNRMIKYKNHPVGWQEGGGWGGGVWGGIGGIGGTRTKRWEVGCDAMKFWY